MEKSRIDGLDMWRAGLLLGGPLMHSVGIGWVIENNARFLFLITQGSHLFRMAAFFAVAGFLAALKQKKEGWLLMRVRQLGIPLMTMTVVMLAVWHFVHNFSEGMRNAPMFPGYLWFLISLLIISAVVSRMDHGLIKKASLWVDKHPVSFLCFGLFVTIVVSIAASVLRWVLFTHFHTSNHFLHLITGHSLNMDFSSNTMLGQILTVVFIETLNFSCFYFLGFFISRSAKCTEVLRKTNWWFVGIPFWVSAMIVASYFNEVTMIPDQNYALKLILIILSTASQYTMAITVIATALRIKRSHAWVQTFSKSAYSVYLLHMPIIFILIILVQSSGLGLNSLVMYAYLMIGSLGLSYALHVLLIEKYPVLYLLFNGKTKSLAKKR